MTDHNQPTAAERAGFLRALGETGSIHFAAEAAGIEPERIYALRDADQAFATAVAQAESRATDVLLREARRRAVDGVEEPIFYQGRQIATVRKYSDSLLSLLVRPALPAAQQRRSGTDGAPDQAEAERIEVRVCDLDNHDTD